MTPMRASIVSALIMDPDLDRMLQGFETQRARMR